MIKRIETITRDLQKCNGKCRRCRWRDHFSGECMRVNNAVEYINAIEADNAKEKVYCMDCIYCQKREPDFVLEDEKYRCLHKDGLSSLYVAAMDYCSKGGSEIKTPEEIKLDLLADYGCCSECEYGKLTYDKPYGCAERALKIQVAEDALAYIQQLERERDAMFKSLQRGRSCLDCAKYAVGMYKNNTACQGCSFGSNWQWRGAEVE